MRNSTKKENWEKSASMLMGVRVKMINVNHIAVYSTRGDLKTLFLEKFSKFAPEFLMIKQENRMIFKLNK